MFVIEASGGDGVEEHVWQGIRDVLRGESSRFLCCRRFLFATDFEMHTPKKCVAKCGQIHLRHATFSHAQSLHSTDDTCAWLKTSSLSCVPKTLTSSTHRGSSFAARDTEHFLTISFFYLSCVVFVYLSDFRPVAHASVCPLRRSTAGWHLPTSHTKCLFSTASVHSHVVAYSQFWLQGGLFLLLPRGSC